MKSAVFALLMLFAAPVAAQVHHEADPDRHEDQRLCQRPRNAEDAPLVADHELAPPEHKCQVPVLPELAEDAHKTAPIPS